MSKKEKELKHPIVKLEKIDWRTIPPNKQLTMKEVASILGIQRSFPVSHVRTYLKNIEEEKGIEVTYKIKNRYYTNIDLLKKAIPQFFEVNEKEMNYNNKLADQLNKLEERFSNVSFRMTEMEKQLTSISNILNDLQDKIKKIEDNINKKNLSKEELNRLRRGF